MGDLDRQEAVEQATGGYVVAVLALAFLTVAVAFLTWSSVATPILGALVVLGGLGLAVMAWAERGQGRDRVWTAWRLRSGVVGPPLRLPFLVREAEEVVVHLVEAGDQSLALGREFHGGAGRG